jgi:hypothetical protein
MNPKDIEKMSNQELADEIARASGIGAPTPDQTMRYGDLNTELVIRLTTDRRCRASHHHGQRVRGGVEVMEA